MLENYPADVFIDLFPIEDIPKILENVQDCCMGLTRESSSEKEDQLSQRLYRKLCCLPEYRTGPIEPHWESWLVDVTPDETEIKGRADIRFSCGRGLETYFLVEAKRLFVTYPGGTKAPLVSKYIKDGMMRYVSGKYATKMQSSAMLGYVFDNDLLSSRAALAAAIACNAVELELDLCGTLKESAIEASPPVEETMHLLKRGRFTIYHILTKV